MQCVTVWAFVLVKRAVARTLVPSQSWLMIRSASSKLIRILPSGFGRGTVQVFPQSVQRMRGLPALFVPNFLAVAWAQAIIMARVFPSLRLSLTINRV